jgi:hypothetical protein
MALIWLDSFLFLMNYPDKPTNQGHKLRPFECAQGSLDQDIFAELRRSLCVHSYLFHFVFLY